MLTRSFVVLAAAAVLAGCASRTELVTNPKPSDTVKAKSFKSYHEVLLLPPKDDPRGVVPRVADDIRKLGFAVRVIDPAKPIEASQGTAFVVGAGGWLVTCAHVVGEQKTATVTLDGKRGPADVVAADAKADLALLRLREPLPPGTPVLRFRAAEAPPKLGEDVATLGFPLSRILGNSVRMTRGLLSATTGLRDDAKQVQVSAQIQPGNSGGPLLDAKGNVVGVVASTINPGAVAQATGGSLPQNVNFAIKNGPVLDFLRSADAKFASELSFDPGTGLAGLEKGVVKVQAGEVGPDSERADKLVVRVSYQSHWDVWYRFRFFVLQVFDYETQEPLFIAGQGRDNLVSNEDVVIRDTMAQFAKGISAR